MEILREIFKGKSLSRTLTNIELKSFSIKGKVLDIGGQKGESHYRFLKRNEFKIETVNVNEKFKPDLVVDLDKEKLPVIDGIYDTILCFNLLEHVYDRKNLLSESFRAIKEGGFLLGSIPFLVNIHPDPHDFARLAKEGLEKELFEAGFKNIKIKAIGRGPYTAAYSQIEFTIPFFLRFLFIYSAFVFDALINILKPKNKFPEKFPLAYIFYGEKK